jgi:hypothetical protein
VGAPGREGVCPALCRASNQTFTLLNPWGWNTNYQYDGFTAAGELNLTWWHLTEYFFLDGDCNPSSAVASQLAMALTMPGNNA